jgi:phospholipid/cholesterol/gamma-HCH transport system substrate-binding protein
MWCVMARPIESVRAAVSLARAHARATVGAVVALALLAAGVVTYLVVSGSPTRTYVAEFVATPGLYTNNSVDILGVPTGSIASIRTGQDAVRVTMHLPAHVRIPANATAVLMAPNPVSDRFVELYPPYTSGPVLPDGAVIPISRTVVPLELDQIFDNLDALATSLGPSGANSNGSVNDVLHALAQIAAGNGTNLRTTLAAIAQALPAFTADPQRVADLVTSLDTLTRTLAQHDGAIDRVLGDLAGATRELAAERDTLGSAIANLQQGLAQLTAFLQSNKARLGASTAQLATTASAIVKEQQALIDTFDTAALGFQNFANTINPNAPCDNGKGKCPAINVRLDLPSDISSIVRNYCGTSAQNGVPILAQTIGVGQANTINTLCTYEFSTEQGSKAVPGAPPVPDLGLASFLK